MKTIKCAWCGSTQPLAGNGQRPKQHRNGNTTCVGSGQLVAAHARLSAQSAAQLAQPRAKAA